MRLPNALYALVLPLLLMGSPLHADVAVPVSRPELEALQRQLLELAQRLDRLEAANAQLVSENAGLRAQAVAGPDTTSPAPVEAGGPVPSASAATKPEEAGPRLKWRGDLRYRHEHIESERLVDGVVVDAADRDRQRIRARLGVDARVTDAVSATFQVGTGGDDPRGSNQTLGDTGSRKSIGLDLAYVDWRLRPDTRLVLGKQPYPLWRPANTLFLDSDLSPEGVALRHAGGPWFANAYGFWLSERYAVDRAGENSDSTVFGLQAGLALDAPGGETTLAAHYFACGVCRDHSPLFANDANGNTTYRVGEANVLRYGYEILELGAQYGTALGAVPLTLTAGYARNLADDVQHDTAYAIGGSLGRLGGAGSWEAGLLYQSVDQDALFGQLADSDFGNGLTDSKGWVFKAGYVPVRNVALSSTVYVNTLDKDVGTPTDVTRLQFDVLYRF